MEDIPLWMAVDFPGITKERTMLSMDEFMKQSAGIGCCTNVFADNVLQHHWKEIERLEEIILTHCKEINRLQEELHEGDSWKKRATEALENGMCPICFATDEAGHKAGCVWGNDLADLELVKEEVESITRERDDTMKENQRLKTGNQALILDLKELQNRANSLEDDLHRSTKENKQLQQDLAEAKHLHKIQLENAIAERERADSLEGDMKELAKKLNKKNLEDAEAAKQGIYVSAPMVSAKGDSPRVTTVNLEEEIEKIRLENESLKKQASYQCAAEWRNLYQDVQKKLDRLREIYREFHGILK